MNENQTAYAIRRELDQAAQSLPSSVTDRLQKARMQSLDHMTDRPTSFWTRAQTDGPPMFTRFAMTALPVLAVAIGAVGISQWSGNQQEQEWATLDEAVLLDELPLTAYADKGFGVFMQNTRQ
jgi:hypothetical protein